MPRPPSKTNEEVVLNTAQKNLAAIIKRSELKVNAWAVMFKLDQSTINRIVTGKQDMTSKQMQKIADAAGFPAWHLLVEGYVPSNPPMLRALTNEERDLYAKIQSDLAKLATLQEHNTRPGDLPS